MGVKGLDQLNELGREVAVQINDAAKLSIKEVANRLIQALQRNAPDNSGYLQQSIAPVLPIKETDNGYVLEIEWEEYGSYQDAGVAGTKSGQSLGMELGYGRDFAYTDKMPPTNVSTIGGQSLRQYADSRGISPFAVARSIFYKGIKATKWASNTIDSPEVQSLIDELAELIVKQYDK